MSDIPTHFIIEFGDTGRDIDIYLKSNDRIRIEYIPSIGSCGHSDPDTTEEITFEQLFDVLRHWSTERGDIENQLKQDIRRITSLYEEQKLKNAELRTENDILRRAFKTLENKSNSAASG
jgi:hypothetical protein